MYFKKYFIGAAFLLNIRKPKLNDFLSTKIFISSKINYLSKNKLLCLFDSFSFVFMKKKLFKKKATPMNYFVLLQKSK
jgi:hypothetical protein